MFCRPACPQLELELIWQVGAKGDQKNLIVTLLRLAKESHNVAVDLGRSHSCESSHHAKFQGVGMSRTGISYGGRQKKQKTKQN